MNFEKINISYMDVLFTDIIKPYFPLIIILPVLISLILIMVFYDFKSLKFTTKLKNKRKLLYIPSAVLIITVIVLLTGPLIESKGAIDNKSNYKINGEAEITKINNTKYKQTAEFIANHKKYIIEIPKNQDVKKGDIIKIKANNKYGVIVNYDGYINAENSTIIDFKYNH